MKIYRTKVTVQFNLKISHLKFISQIKPEECHFWKATLGGSMNPVGDETPCKCPEKNNATISHKLQEMF